MDFRQFVKTTKFWSFLICIVVIIFQIILILNISEQECGSWKVVAKCFRPCAILPIFVAFGLPDLPYETFLLSLVLWGSMNFPIYIVDIIAIYYPDWAIFMPTAPSNFLGYFLYGLFPSRPIAGFLLAEIFALLLQVVALLLAYLDYRPTNQDESTEAQANQNGPMMLQNDPVQVQCAYQIRLVVPRPVYVTHVNPLDDKPPSYSSLNLSKSNEVDTSLPTYEEALELEVQRNLTSTPHREDQGTTLP